jgi:diketogulonate reductase-like aldo/keto reductase
MLISRRKCNQLLLLSTAYAALSPRRLALAAESNSSVLRKKIPSSSELLPVIGMGTWISFNVGPSERLRNQRCKVLAAFFEAGGGIIDSSPMYGSSEEVLGYCLEKVGQPQTLFSATKVWTDSKQEGLEQIRLSHRLWGIEKFDLFQVHNLLNWEQQLETLLAMKQASKLRYVGITTSHGRRHSKLEHLMKTQPIDFVQLTFNILNRTADNRLLNLAKERKIAVIANRPFAGGSLIKRLKRKAYPLPTWANDFQSKTWADFLLKFIVSHPAVTCAIPATSKVEHMRENMQALRGRLPTAQEREKMLRYLQGL